MDNINLLVPKGTRATRKCVVKNDTLIDIVGGANYFPNYPKDDKTDILDELLKSYNDTQDSYDVKIDFLISILQYLESSNKKNGIIKILFLAYKPSIVQIIKNVN